MAGIPEILDQKETDQEITERLAELESLLQETEKIRRLQSLISGVTVLVVLVILIFFILGLAAFFRTYPKRLLVQEIVHQNQMISDYPLLSGTDRNSDRKMMLSLFRSISREQPFRKPVFRQKLRAEIRSLNQYAQQDLRLFFRNQLYQCLREETRRYLAARNHTPGRVQKNLIRQLNLELSAELTDRIFRDLDAANRTVSLFQGEAALLRQSCLYRELSGKPLETVEDRLLENLLECLICRLNESKALAGPERSPDYE